MRYSNAAMLPSFCVAEPASTALSAKGSTMPTTHWQAHPGTGVTKCGVWHYSTDIGPEIVAIYRGPPRKFVNVTCDRAKVTCKSCLYERGRKQS